MEDRKSKIENGKLKDLNLPIIKKPDPKPRRLSMDEYLEFVTFNIESTLDREAYHKWKKMLAVDVRFKMD